MSTKIGYIINQYPKVSHSFIRREILALESLGIDVFRISARGWDAQLLDHDDLNEQKKTHYLLKKGALRLVLDMISAVIASPLRFFSALSTAIRLGRGSDRGVLLHLIYFAEACSVRQLVAGKGIEHFHAHFGTNPAALACLSSRLTGIPYSFTVHGPEEFDRPAQLKIKEKIENAKAVIGVSSFGRSQLYRWVTHQYWHKVQVVHCALEKSFHTVTIEPQSAPRLVCIGRLCEQKGQLLLLEAAAKLLQRGIHFELVLAGDGDMRNEVESSIRRLSLENHVSITGWISSDEVRSQLLAARAMVLPSFAEGLPVVIMESLALCRPVITTYIAGIPELVRNKENGWLVPAGDVIALADAMQECLAVDAPTLKVMGDAGRERVLLRHDAETEAKKLIQIFSTTEPK